MKLKIPFLSVILFFLTLKIYAQEAPIINDKKMSPLFIAGLSCTDQWGSVFMVGGVRINKFAPYIKIQALTYSCYNMSGGAITGGCLFRVFKPLFIQTGFGYGNFVETGDFFPYEKKYYAGLTIENGIVFRYKFILVSYGVSRVLDEAFKDEIYYLGIGVMF